MDKSWIGTKKCTIKYIRGCEAFLDFAFAHNEGRKYINCPCKRCLNRFYYNRDRVREHILVDGFSPDYKIWTSHGEHYGESENVNVNDNHEHFPVDNMFEMVHDIYGDHEVEGGCSSMGPDGDTEKMLKLIEDAERVLYPGCEKYTTLSFVIRFLQLKVRFGFSNTCFDEMMVLLKDAFPSGETLPASYYEAKKFRDSLGFKYVKYDACPNDCMLYWKDKALVTKCDICSEPRYKEIEYDSYNGQKRKKQTPRKQVRYFPIKERLQRLYMSSKSAKSMRWHAESLVEDAAKMHPAHYKAWKAFDERHPDFANDRRNIRLGLASDGFNPFNTITIPYSVWPVVLIPYNQEPGRCMKRTSMMLTLLIDGDRQPGNNIDVYLQPLIEDLKYMWNEGVRTYDADSDEMFQLRAALLWTINDFPAFANLSGWSTRGEFACPTCNSETDSRWLTYGRKHSYGGHRRFLPTNHPFRKDKRNFVGKAETRARPPVLSGEDLFRQVEGIENKFGKKAKTSKKRPRISKKKASKPKHNWKKRSIFYELPYWKYNMLRHNLDVMHIEKNVCESIVFTLLGVDGRTKDNLNSRRDLKELRIRKSLHPILQGKNGKEVCPPAPFTLTNEQKTKFLQILKDVKFPDNYASNIGRCVNVKERTIQGLKSHDYHVLMQQVLPIALRKVLPKHVAKPLIELCTYFRHLCSRGLKDIDVDQLSEKIILTLCHLEKIFPPSFFDVMVHLPVHLADEAAIGGSVHMRWMYPIERYIRTLKQYVRQRHHAEGSIAEGYVTEECLIFCSRYLDDTVETTRPNCNREGALGERRQRYLSELERDQAHRYVLANSACIDPFKVKHIDYLRKRHRIDEFRLLNKHHEEFPEWLRSYVESTKTDHEITNEVKVLSRGPSPWASSFTQGYTINGKKFHTMAYGAGLKTQNTGVMLRASTPSFATVKDRYPVVGDVNYYGRLIDVLEIQYPIDTKFTMFRCEWVDNVRGQKVDEYGFTLVNFKHQLYRNNNVKDEPFIFASQAEQVWYVDDGLNWKVAVPMKPTASYKCSVDVSTETCPEAEPFPDQQLGIEDNLVDDGESEGEDEDDTYETDDSTQGELWEDNEDDTEDEDDGAYDIDEDDKDNTNDSDFLDDL